MKVFIAGIRTETNSFVARRTQLADFQRRGFFPGGNARSSPDPAYHPGYAAMMAAARAEGHEVTCGPAAYAVPGGPVTVQALASLRESLLASLHSWGGGDLVLLDLHGAMMAEGMADVEGQLLSDVRSLVGDDTIISTLIDPHAVLTRAMLEAASLIVAYREYPHTDIAVRGKELFARSSRLKREDLRPTWAMAPCGVLGGFPTTREPMRSFVRSLAIQEEAAGIVSVSLVHGFPWSDQHENGAKVLVYSEDGAPPADRVAGRLAASFRSIARRASARLIDPACAAEAALSKGAGKLVIADASDNPGGGADGDATHVLGALMNAGITGIGAAVFFDPESCETCMKAAEGGEVSLALGGRQSSFSGQPIMVEGRVEAIIREVPPTDGWSYPPLPPLVRLRSGFGDVILSSERQEALSPIIFELTGAKASDYDILLLKSSNHFRESFATGTERILSVGSPTAMNPQLRELPFRKIARPIWPLDDWDAVTEALTPETEVKRGA